MPLRLPQQSVGHSPLPPPSDNSANVVPAEPPSAPRSGEAAAPTPYPGSPTGTRRTAGAASPTPPSADIVPYGRLGVWPIGGRIPFIKCCKKLFFVHRGSKYRTCERTRAPRRREPGIRGRPRSRRCPSAPAGTTSIVPARGRVGAGDTRGGPRGNASCAPSSGSGCPGRLPLRPRETPRRAPDSHVFANPGSAKRRLASVPGPDGPSRHVQTPRRRGRPHSASPAVATRGLLSP